MFTCHSGVAYGNDRVPLIERALIQMKFYNFSNEKLQLGEVVNPCKS
ncbi:MAG: hypothetical protein IJW64_01740 [Clostridia bacterium]|nr:hypothetical protein [Clostridia bacterium]